MKNFLKILLWALVIGIIFYLAFGRTKKEVGAPTPEMTGGPAGERAMMSGEEILDLEMSSEMSL